MSTLDRISPEHISVVAIGASTGAPMILEEIICNLPADLSTPILIAQHLPPQFTASFATQLDRNGALTAVEADTDMPVLPGVAYVGRGREHLRVRGEWPKPVRLEVSADPVGLPFKPSADELLNSCVKVYGPRTLAIIMTGIGDDGCAGAKAVHQAGGIVLTQEKSTCAVYGMPLSCVKAGVSDAQLTPEEIRRAILRLSPTHEPQADAA